MARRLLSTRSSGALGPAKRRSEYVRALAARLEAHLEIAHGGGPAVEEHYRNAIVLFGAAGAAIPRAVYQLELAEWLHASGRVDEALEVAAEARGLFESVRAAPWLARCAAIGAVNGAAVPLPG